MLQKNRSYSARRLNFVIANVDSKWTGNSVYKWEWSGQRPTYQEVFTRAVTGAEEKRVKQMSSRSNTILASDNIQQPGDERWLLKRRMTGDLFGIHVPVGAPVVRGIGH